MFLSLSPRSEAPTVGCGWMVNQGVKPFADRDYLAFIYGDRCIFFLSAHIRSLIFWHSGKDFHQNAYFVMIVVPFVANRQQ